jgi:hypothetical protein
MLCEGNPIKHNVGDVVLVDFNVRGIDVGTPHDPKFSLKMQWKYVLIPSFDALVAVGGPAEGAVIAHQEDNASPHQKGDFHSGAFASRVCEKRMEARTAS